MKILNFGSLNIDHVYHLEHFVTAKETQAALGYQRNVGGKGLNQSIALSRAGLDVMHAGKIGADGNILKDFLEKHHVDTSFVKQSEKASGHAIIQIVDGENCIIVYGGANRDIDQTMINHVFDSFGPGDILLAQNEINAIGTLLRKAREKDMRIILNPSPINEELFSCPLSFCEMMILNEVEGAALAHLKECSYETILHALAQQYPQTHIVLTCGENGARAYLNGKFYYQKAYKAEVIDSTCAGDTFTGFYIKAFLHGYSVQQALSIACRASSFSIQKKGAAISIPLWDQVIFEEKGEL